MQTTRSCGNCRYRRPLRFHGVGPVRLRGGGNYLRAGRVELRGVLSFLRGVLPFDRNVLCAGAASHLCPGACHLLRAGHAAGDLLRPGGASLYDVLRFARRATLCNVLCRARRATLCDVLRPGRPAGRSVLRRPWPQHLRSAEGLYAGSTGAKRFAGGNAVAKALSNEFSPGMNAWA